MIRARAWLAWLGKRLTPGRAFALAAVCLAIVHLALVLHTTRKAPLFAEPLAWIDFATHAEQTFRVTEAMDQFGKSWLYDPQQLAGFPSGTLFDADNKGWELWTYVLWKVGLPKVVAFNLLVLFAHLLVVPVSYLAARQLRLRRGEALLAAALAMGVWFFDGMARWSWYSGAVAFCIVSCSFVLPLALMYRFLRDGGWYRAVALAVAMAATHLMHPSVFVLLLVPMSALYLRSFRALSRPRHAAIWAVALFTIAANAWWLLVALRFAHYLTDHQSMFVGTSSFLATDYVGLTQDLNTTGIVSNRTAFRFLAWMAAIAGLVFWRKERDDRLLPVGLGLATLLALAYLGGYSGLLRQIQQYRNVVPAAFLACIPAAAFFGSVVSSGSLQAIPAKVKATLAIAALLAIPHFAQDVLYFFPKSLPDIPALTTGTPPPLSAMGFHPHAEYRHAPPPVSMVQLAEWVRQHDDGHGRFLVEWWVMSEYLLTVTNAQILGGFHELNMKHAAANLFSRRRKGERTAEHVRRYFEDYAIEWVILNETDPGAVPWGGELEFVTEIHPYRVYRTKVPVQLIASGGGTVRWSMNRLQVTGSDPAADLVLRFHWLETLRCEPDCELVREPVEGDEVGFLRIPAPHPAELAVVNRYGHK
jgi:hypothetical protein